MKKTILGFSLCLALITCISWVGYSNTLSQRTALHILATIGRYAWIAFNADEVSHTKRITKFGYNFDVDTAAEESIAAFGGSATAQFGLSAETLEISSASANDTSAGTGARNILITCINSEGLEINIPVTMNGTSTVTTTQECKFVNRAIVFASGTARGNQGDINIFQSSSGIQLAQIPAEKSTTQQLIYYVPADRRCFIDNISINARRLGSGTSRYDISVLIWSQSQQTVYGIRNYLIDTNRSLTVDRQNFKAEQIRPNEIISFNVDVSSNNSAITGSMDLTCRLDDSA